MLFMALVSVFLVCFIKFMPTKLRMHLGFSLQSQEINVDEDLPNFFDTIGLGPADELVIEENNMMEIFGF
jgi:hypothetical protein